MKNMIAIKNDVIATSAKPVRQQALKLDIVAVEQRMLEVLDSMMRERWLPIGFRTLLVQELPVLRRANSQPRLREVEIVNRLRELLSAAEEYGGSVLRSTTVSLLRSFEYEFDSRSIAA